MTATVQPSKASSSGGRRLRAFLIYALPPLIALLVVLVPALSTVSVLPRLGASPGFALIDQRGETLTSEDLRGDIVVLGLASLDCGSACQTTLEAMREVAATFANPPGGGERPDVRLVTIIVNPVDRPETLQRFASAEGIGGERWSVVSGSEATLRAVIGSGFRVYVGRADDGAVTHDPAVFLSDHAGILRAEYRTGSPRASLIAGDVERILAEASAGRVQGLLYNAAHSLSLSCGS